MTPTPIYNSIGYINIQGLLNLNKTQMKKLPSWRRTQNRMCSNCFRKWAFNNKSYQKIT